MVIFSTSLSFFFLVQVSWQVIVCDFSSYESPVLFEKLVEMVTIEQCCPTIKNEPNVLHKKATVAAFNYNAVAHIIYQLFFIKNYTM